MNIAQQIRGARGVIGWNQQDLADMSDVSKSAIVAIEQERVEPETSTLRKLRLAFEREGIFLSENSITKRDLFTLNFTTYLEVLEDVSRSLPNGGEVLIHCADDTKSSEEVRAKLDLLKKQGIRFRITICEGNNFISGDVRDYRWIDKDYFAVSEVSIIYANKVVHHVADANHHLFTAIVSASHAHREKHHFEYFWRHGKAVGGN